MVDRRKKLIQKIRAEWDKAVAENPGINWKAEGLDIDMAEFAFEEMANDYLVGKSIEKEALGALFQARTEAYKEASL